MSAEVCEAAEMVAERAVTLLQLLQPWAQGGEEVQRVAAELTLQLAKLGSALDLARLTT